MIQQPGDPVSLKLRAGRPVAEGVRTLRAVDEEEIGEVRRCHSEMGANTLRPLFLQRLALRATNVDAGQPAGHGVEAGRQDKNVQVMLAGRCPDPAARHPFDRGGAEVDKPHIGLIEDLVEVLFERRPLDAVGMKRLRRREHLGNGRIFDPRPGLVAPEPIGGAVDVLVHQDVVERADPWRKATRLPEALEGRLPLKIGRLGPRLCEEIDVGPREGLCAPVIDLRIPLLHTADRVLVELRLPHRQRHVGRALEDREVSRHAGRLLSHLHAARPGADDPDPLAGHIETLLRPKRGVVALPDEIAQARQLRHVGLRPQAGAQHEIAGRCDGAVVRTDDPAITRRVELRLGHAPVEADIPAETELLVDVAEILADFLPRWIELAELPRPPQVLARILIDRAGGIDPGPRITVPIPDTAKAAPSLEHLNGHAHAAQTVEKIEAGKPRADHDDVEILDLTILRLLRLSRAHRLQFL